MMENKFTQISDETNAISKAAVDAAFKVHMSLGHGLLESVYGICLCLCVPVVKL
jgi:hypothetical protein